MATCGLSTGPQPSLFQNNGSELDLIVRASNEFPVSDAIIKFNFPQFPVLDNHCSNICYSKVSHVAIYNIREKRIKSLCCCFLIENSNCYNQAKCMFSVYVSVTVR